MSGPLGNLPGMFYDHARNRYFPIPKASEHNPNQTEEDTRPRPPGSPFARRLTIPVPRPNFNSGSSPTSRSGPSNAYPAGPSRMPPASAAPASSSNQRSSQARSSARPRRSGQQQDPAEIDARYKYIRRQGNRDVPAGVHRNPPPHPVTQGPAAPYIRINDDGDRISEGPLLSITISNPGGDSTTNANAHRNRNFSSPSDPRFASDTNSNPGPRIRSFDDVTAPTRSGCLPPDSTCGVDGRGVGGKRGRGSGDGGRSGFGAAGSLDRVSRIRKGRFGVKYGCPSGTGAIATDRHIRTQAAVLSDLQLNQVHHACECRGEIITSYKSVGQEAYYATTDHGTMIIHSPTGNTSAFNVCSEKLVGVHCDVPRLVMMAIAGGIEPHLHLFKRDPEMLNHVFMTHSELDLKRTEIYGVSSFDDVCTLGSSKSITTISYSSHLGSKNRRLPSDALAVHQASRDLVFVGQRNGRVGLEDLRTAPPASLFMQNVVAATQNEKAIVGVKRLDDAAVPWGLVVGGLGHEGMATSPDDKVLFASGSDRRVRAWSTLTGETIFPSYPPPAIPPPSLRERERECEGAKKTFGADSSFHQNDRGVFLGGDGGVQEWQESEQDNPLYRVYENRVTHLSVTEGMGLDVVHKGELMRFGRK
ncbi:hypothetical protein I317_05133 [Kwoniella heveanensis CBS 569]|nr:hypothetical protein I317_05133 [Kwoniella heveanensis CBS 569]